MLNNNELISWLMEGDVSIQYQTKRDLLGKDDLKLRKRIASEGWGKQFLLKRNENGHWGIGFYQPKWISSHYTLLDLKNLNISPDVREIKDTIRLIIKDERGIDYGINPHNTMGVSDVCVNGMFLNYATYFGAREEDIKKIIDFILSQKMNDGGFNCRLNRTKAKHGSLHSTLCVLEGLTEYEKQKYTYRLDEIHTATKLAKEFVLMHQLYISDRTGEVINDKFLQLSYPGRWKYDVLKAMDYFQYAGEPFDERMIPALNVILKKKNKDGSWNVQTHHPGKTHFIMEQAGKPSRWNTLRALRVLRRYSDFF